MCILYLKTINKTNNLKLYIKDSYICKCIRHTERKILIDILKVVYVHELYLMWNDSCKT